MCALFPENFKYRKDEGGEIKLQTIRRFLIPLAAPVTSLALPAIAWAQGEVVPTQFKATNIAVIIQGIIRFILIAAFVIAFIMLLVGGIRWILAGGDEKAVASARGTITAALIGLVIVLVAFALIRLVEIFFGVQIISGEGICIPTVFGTETGCVEPNVDPGE